MTSERPDTSATTTVLDSIHGTRDALSVRRVFGDPQELDGVTIIPVRQCRALAVGDRGDTGKVGDVCHRRGPSRSAS